MLLVAFGAVTVFAVILAFTRPDPAFTVVRILLLTAFVALPWGAVQVGGVPLGDVPLMLALAIMAVLYLPRARLYLPIGIPVGALLIAVSGLLTEAMPPSQAYVGGRYVIDLNYLVNVGVELRSLSNLGTLFKYEISLAVLPLVALLAVAMNSRMAKQLATAWVVGVLISDLVAYTDSIGITSVSKALLGYVNVEARFSGLTPQPNFVGVQTAMVLPLILLALRRSTTRRRVCAVVALGIAGIALLSSGSRGSAVAAVIAVPLTLIAVPAVRAWIARTVFVFIGGIALVLVTPTGAKILASVRLSGDAEGVDQSDGDRLASRHQAFADIVYSPLHGIGWGHSIDAHMIYLQVLAAGGLIAGVGFVWYVGNVLTRAWRDLRPTSVLAGGLIASAMTWIVLGLVENQLTDQWAYVPFALLIAMICQAHVASVGAVPAIADELPLDRASLFDDSDAPSHVEPRQKQPSLPFSKDFIRPLPRPIPISVVVNAHDGTHSEPVGVHARQRDLTRTLARQGLLFVADDVVDALGWIARLGRHPLPIGHPEVARQSWAESRGHHVWLSGGHDQSRVLFVVVVVDHRAPESSNGRLQSFSCGVLDRPQPPSTFHPSGFCAARAAGRVSRSIESVDDLRPVVVRCLQVEVSPPFLPALQLISERGKRLMLSQFLR